MGDASAAAVGVSCLDAGHRARCVTRNPPTTSVTDSRTRNLRIPIGLSSLLHGDRRVSNGLVHR